MREEGSIRDRKVVFRVTKTDINISVDDSVEDLLEIDSESDQPNLIRLLNIVIIRLGQVRKNEQLGNIKIVDLEKRVATNLRPLFIR